MYGGDTKTFKSLVELLKETHVWDLGVDGRIILNNILWRGLD
jgi:hypothetical protein